MGCVKPWSYLYDGGGNHKGRIMHLAGESEASVLPQCGLETLDQEARKFYVRAIEQVWRGEVVARREERERREAREREERDMEYRKFISIDARALLLNDSLVIRLSPLTTSPVTGVKPFGPRRMRITTANGTITVGKNTKVLVSFG